MTNKNIKPETLIKSFDELMKSDLTKDRISLDDLYKSVCEYEKKIKDKNAIAEEEEMKQRNQELVFIETGSEIVDKDYFEEILNRRNVIHSFIKKFDVNSKVVSNMNSGERDKLYAICDNLMGSFFELLLNTKMSITFTKSEFVFMRNFFTTDIKYNLSEVFTLKKLEESYFDEWRKIKPKKEHEIVFDTFSVQGFNYFLETQKISAFGEDRDIFMDLASKFAKCVNFVNASTAIAEPLKSDYAIWLSALNEDLKRKTGKRESIKVED